MRWGILVRGLAALLATGTTPAALAVLLAPGQITVTSSGDSIDRYHTIDRSGLMAVGGINVHGNDVYSMWLASPQPEMWITWEFDKVYEVKRMNVWNFNQTGYQARGMRHITIETSIDGVTWSTVNADYQLQSANSAPELPVTDVLTLGVTAKYVRFTGHPLIGSTTVPPGGYSPASGNWGDSDRLGLAEVEFDVEADSAPVVVPSTGVVMSAAIQLEFHSEPNVVYRLQSTPDLAEVPFQDTEVRIVGDGASMILYDAVGSSETYRIAAPSTSTEVPLVVEGQPNAVIVIPDELPPLPVPITHPLFIEFGLMESHTRTSAEILAHYIRQSTGADLPIIPEAAAPSTGLTIHVGNTALTRTLVPVVEELDADGFAMIIPDESCVLLRGASPQGTEFAVYDFLERELGVRWLFPGELGEHVPSNSNVSVSGPVVVKEPAFRSRLFRIRGEGGAEWTRRNRLHSRIEFHHNISKLIPLAWTNSHPDYFPLLNGERYFPTTQNQDDWHLNYTASGIVEDTAQLLIDNFTSYPVYQSISLGVSDAPESGYCQDSACEAIKGTNYNALGYRDYADLYYGWCNQVVSQVVAQLPAKTFGCLAYREVSDPPSFPIHDSLVPYLTYELIQWVDPARQQVWKDQVVAPWKIQAANFGHYEYMFGEEKMLVPRLYLHALADYCRYVIDQGAVGFFAETTGSHADTVWYAGPQPYILMRLLWDPDSDVDALLTDWCTSAVGSAGGPHLEAYFRLWERIWTEEVPQTAWFGTQNKILLDFNSDGYLDAVTMQDLDTAEQHLADAAQAAPLGLQKQRADLFLAEFQQRRTQTLDARVAP